MKSLDEMLQPGNKIKRHYKKGHRGNLLMHIRAVIEGGEWIVHRVWWKSKQRWHYEVEWRYRFEMDYQDGLLRYAGRSKDEPS